MDSALRAVFGLVCGIVGEGEVEGEISKDIFKDKNGYFVLSEHHKF